MTLDALIATFGASAGVLPEATVLVTRDGVLRAVNPAFSEMFGWTPDAVVGTNLVDLAATPADSVLDYLRHCAVTRRLLPGALTLRDRSGEPIECRTGGGALQPAGDDLPALVLLRLVPRTAGSRRFLALTQKIDELSVEIGRRRAAEAAAAVALERQHDLRDRLEVLTEASGSLFASLSVENVLPAIGELAERLIRADAFAIWKHDAAAGQWHVIWRRHLSEDFVSAIEGWRDQAAPVALGAPLTVSNVEDVPLLSARRAAYTAEGIQGLTIIPLEAFGETRATVVAYFRRPVAFSDEDRRLAAALGRLGCSAVQTALLYDEQARSRRASEQARRRATFLARAGSALASSLDYEGTLKAVAELAVPEIADWCAVDIVMADGALKRLAVAHIDAAKIDFAIALREQYPDDPARPGGLHDVIRRREPVLIERIPDEMLVAAARDERHLLMIRELGLGSYMCVPLVVRGRALGALTFAMSESERTYTRADLEFAKDVAARAALAVENARAYDEVRRANRLKDEFLATLSHELRTPLNAVLGYTRMLRAGVLPPEKQPPALDTIERNATSLAQLVEDVLDVSRIEAGKIRLNVQPVDVPAIIHSAIATVAPAADARGVGIEPIVDPQVPAVSGDPDRLQQVVWNLVSNAVKFTPRGGRVQVRLERVNSHVEIIVSDTGIGISREFLPHVFERFRQGDSRFAREYGGLGLGLAITRHLVEMHGGIITVESDGPGRGTTFRVKLPLAIVHGPSVTSEVREHPQAVVDDPSLPLADLTDVHVLVVDDDGDALELVREVLEAAGARVTTATSGATALEVISGVVPHVLISDIGMPGMDGFELITRIRADQDPERRNLPAAALTAYARSDNRTRALERGFQMHLAKPIHPSELAAAVRALAGRRTRASGV